jgi:polyether ionophore transport system ATP-binding protein
MEAIFQDTIREIIDDGRTVLLSSHILAQVEALCDRVTIIRAGHAVEHGTLADLRHLTRTAISVETERPVTGLERLPGIHNPVLDGVRATFDVDTAHIDVAVRHLTTFGIRTLTSQPPTLEELFLRHYGDEIALLEGTDLEGASG